MSQRGEQGTQGGLRTDHVVYLGQVHLDLFDRLAGRLLDSMDDEHMADGAMPANVQQLRAEVVEAIDRLDEARRRGPGGA